MMNYLEEYDETDPISIETYAKRLIGKTFADVCKQDDITKAMVVRETTNYEVIELAYNDEETEPGP